MTPVTPSLSLRLLETIKLPDLDCEPGPIHTILHDDHNIYYSDEVNHSIVSLNASGALCWHRTKKGNAPGEFNYPKGIDLGFINEKGTRTPCIAVCDSWNRRIQFFDSTGRFLTLWDSVNTATFSDVVDIRFINTDAFCAPGTEFWLVLDRGHHALFGMDLSGSLLFKIGRFFPEIVDAHRPLPCDSRKTNSPPHFSLCEYLPYDPLFMPVRIFGSTQEAIFIYESRSRRLKQAILGNFLPVSVNLPGDAEWIGADADALVSFNKSTGKVGTYDVSLKTWLSASIEGRPIPSSRSSKELWAQKDSSISLWRCSREEKSINDHAEFSPWILSILPDEIDSFAHSGIDSAGFNGLREAVSHLRDISNQALAIAAQQWSNSSFSDQCKAGLASSSQNFSSALSQMAGILHAIFLKILSLETIHAILPTDKDDQLFLETRNLVDAATNKIYALFEEILLFNDEFFIARIALASLYGDAYPAQQSMLREYNNAILGALQKLAKSLWFIPLLGRQKTGTQPAKEKNTQHFSCKISGGHFPSSRNASSCLREIDRLFIGDPAIPGSAGPATICYSPRTGIYIALQNFGKVLRLDESGKVLGFLTMPPASANRCMRPLSIAIDDSERIWISVPSENRIEIIDLNTNQIQSLDSLAGKSLGLKSPSGIFRASNGQMLIADSNNCQIIAASRGGEITTLVDRPNNNIGELRHPYAFCSANEATQFWVVETRNHCLQRFNLQGESFGRLGSRGLGHGHLVLPTAASVFDDGMIAVSQWQCTKELKLFSTDGEGLEALPVDYYPWGILAYKSMLLVCEGFGDHIRVYERS